MTRNGRNFDYLAIHLADCCCSVACPDIVGRGRSDWLLNPQHYSYTQYLADMTALIARLDADEIDWVGTSMGGIIGMMLAAQPKSPIRHLVLNDIGAFIPKAGLARIANYVGTEPVFDGIDEVIAYLHKILAGFGPMTEMQWAHIALHSVRYLQDGRLGLAYDPGIGEIFKGTPIGDVSLWGLWDMIKCPVLVLRGVDSDILLAETAMEMAQRGSKARVVEIPLTAHAPALMLNDQVNLVCDFLLTK